MSDTFDYSKPRRPQWQIALDNAPVVTYSLCAICVVLTVAYFTSSEYGNHLWYVIGHIADPGISTVWDGRYDLLFTTMFLHGNAVHIVFNLLWLYRLGRILEPGIGWFRYLLIVIASSVVGSCVEILVSGSPGIGASGVVYALFGLMWAGRGASPSWRMLATRQNLQILVAWGIFCLATTEAGLMSVASGAHAGGFLFGLCIGGLFFAPRRKLIWLAPLGVLLIACVLSLTYMPWSEDWVSWKADQEFGRQRYLQAIAWSQRSIALGGATQYNWGNIETAWQMIERDAAQRHDKAAFDHAKQEAEAAAKNAGDKAGDSD